MLRVGTTLYAGRGGRTNAEGIRQLRRLVASPGFAVVPVPLHRVLHLKSAVTALPDGTVIAADPSLIDTSPFPSMRIVPEEAGSHVILLGGGTVLMAASAPRSAELFDDWGFDVVVVDIGEFEKMEGCVTCLSVLIQSGGDAMEHHDRHRAVMKHSGRHRAQQGPGDPASATGAHAEQVERLLL